MRTGKIRKKRGSLTIEAAMILPLYMICLLALSSLLLILLTRMRLKAQTDLTAQKLARIYSNGERVLPEEARDYIADGLQKEDLRRIENGRDGMDMTGSRTDDPEYVYLCVSCRLLPMSRLPGTPSVKITEKSLVHVWNGYENGFFPDEEYVFVTKDSDVYHLDRDCSHIRLTIKEAGADEIGSLRNDNGGRYRPCSSCHASLSDGRLFITPEGDRYHNSITCSGLKRTVRMIRKNEVGDRRPCSRCGR